VENTEREDYDQGPPFTNHKAEQETAEKAYVLPAAVGVRLPSGRDPHQYIQSER
jgi:hypothetical protein